MIHALTCLLFPFLSGCPAYVREVPRISAVAQHRAFYTARTILVTGRVRSLRQWRSRSGYDEEVFSLCDGACVRVFMERHSPIRDGELVSVSGPYYQAYRVGRDTYDNEIEANEILPRE